MISGSGEMLLDGDVIELGMGLVRVAPTTVRAFAAGPDGMEVIAVGGPKPEGGDGETRRSDLARLLALCVRRRLPAHSTVVGLHDKE